jgi:oligosaccharide repeat unit polymerase
MSRVISLVLFFIYIIPFTIVYNKDYQLTYLSILFLFSGFYFGNIILKTRNLKPIDYSNFMVSNNFLFFIFFALYIFFKHELVFNVFTHLIQGDFIEWSLETATSRYRGFEEEPGLLYNLGTTCMFIYASLLGTIEKRKYYFLFIFGLLFIFLIESSTLGRAGTFTALIALFSELIIRKNNFFQKLSYSKLFKYSFFPILIVSVLFLYSAYNRLGPQDDVNEILIIKLGEYIIGPYEAFFIWHNNFAFNDTSNPFLFSLFTSIYKLGGISVDQGAYDLIKTNYGYTNIFTVMRGLYTDLGFYFSFLVLFLYGLLLKYFTFKRMNYFQYFYVRVLLSITLMVVYSPFYFTTFLIANIISYLLLFIINNNINLKKQTN